MNPAPPVTNTRSPIRRRLRKRSGALGSRQTRTGAATLVLAAVCAVALAACGGSGSSSATTPRRAAEPAESPPLHATPVGRTAPVGRELEGIAWDAAAELIAVGVRQPAQVVFLDPASLKVAHRVPLPAPLRHLSYDATAAAVLVPAESANEMLIVRPSGVVTATKVGTHPHDATSVGANVFVADEHSDQVSVLRAGHLVKALPTPHQPGGIAAVDGRWVALVAVSARVLQVYDAHTLKPLGSTPAGVGPSHIVARGATAYVADTQGEEILVYAIGPHPRLLGEVAAPGTPYGLAIDPGRDRLWVTETATDRLTEYSVGGRLPRRVATYPVLRQPNSVAVDPRTGQVFVAGRDAGQVERITPAKGNG